MDKVIFPVPRRPRRWPIWLALGLTAAALTGAYIGIFHVNTFSLELQLQGSPEMTVEAGQPFEDPGVKPVLRGTRLLQQGREPEIQVQCSGAVDTQKKGKYFLSYGVNYLLWNAQQQRIVRVVDTQAPELTLIPDPAPSLEGGEYVEAGFSARDNYDGDLTEQVVRYETDGMVTYTVVDSSGNPAMVQREIPKRSELLPKILLVGDSVIETPVGGYFYDPGFSAIDRDGRDLTDRVTVEDEVVWYQPGNYRITYRVEDDYGDCAEEVRFVRILRAEKTPTVWPQQKTIYLTFDDGPGPLTPQLLDTLAAYGAKATFFVVDSGYPEIMQRIVNEGHSLGIHTMTHNYDAIYASPEAYFRDLQGMQQKICDATGYQTWLMRFPGGSSNTVSRRDSEGIMTLLTRAVEDAGFRYFDWNVDSNDAGGAHKASIVRDNVIRGVQEQQASVVLQHDIHAYSVAAVEEILRWGQDNGYTFEALTMDSPEMHHTVNN